MTRATIEYRVNSYFLLFCLVHSGKGFHTDTQYYFCFQDMNFSKIQLDYYTIFFEFTSKILKIIPAASPGLSFIKFLVSGPFEVLIKKS